MTNEEAIKAIKDNYPTSGYYILREALDMAMEALEKQVPKKPIRKNRSKKFDGNWKMMCPSCGETLIQRITTTDESYPIIYNSTNHCICGQTIDWSEEDEN